MSGLNMWASRLVKNGSTPKTLHTALLAKGAHPCVAREWANEPRRREVLERRRLLRKERKEASKVGHRGEPFRRIMSTEPWGEDRERQFHATKGWRIYRRVE